MFTFVFENHTFSFVDQKEQWELIWAMCERLLLDARVFTLVILHQWFYFIYCHYSSGTERAHRSPIGTGNSTWHLQKINQKKNKWKPILPYYTMQHKNKSTKKVDRCRKTGVEWRIKPVSVWKWNAVESYFRQFLTDQLKLNFKDFCKKSTFFYVHFSLPFLPFLDYSSNHWKF